MDNLRAQVIVVICLLALLLLAHLMSYRRNTTWTLRYAAIFGEEKTERLGCFDHKANVAVFYAASDIEERSAGTWCVAKHLCHSFSLRDKEASGVCPCGPALSCGGAADTLLRIEENAPYVADPFVRMRG